MSILKFQNFNKYFQKVILISILLLLSLIPWIEFINSNLDELDFILNDNLVILLSLYFLLVFLIYLILKNFTSLKEYSLISFILISTWTLFQHNFLKNNINIFFQNINLSNQYSSEIALVIIMMFVCLFFNLIKIKKIFTFFFLFFLTFNFFFSFANLVQEFNVLNKNHNIKKSKINLISNVKKPNIYFFILDSMMPLNEFKDYYEKDLSDFEKFFKQKKYIYFKNTINLYPNTRDALTSLFFLDEIFIKKENYENNNLKQNVYQKFPNLLSHKYNPLLISKLNKLGYEFKWIGNSFAACSRYNYRYCLSEKKEEYIDLYLLQAFLQKTPFMQIFNKLTEQNIVQKYVKINQRGDAIGKLKKFLISNEDYIKTKSTFFFIHHIHPHWPYKHDEQCNFKNFPGKTNFEGYKNSYLCVIKNIKNIIEIIDQLDGDAMVIFQSDHSWEMSKISETKYGSRRKIFNLVKNNFLCGETIPAGLNNVQILDYLIKCL
ncbi:sulfatase-like hydrolase/transferase [Candidatus Pelagibacter sp.]|nr:sulfatase-like hydrolase/transferase [Candidatus Pelagibacter sp.]